MKDIAIMYDFDGTLASGNIQEYNFIPALNMASGEFWEDVNDLATKNNMDTNLAYMYLMLKMAENKNISIKRDSFKEYGRNVHFYPGVMEWFDRINDYGKSIGVNVHHYIISSGIKEMIEGTKIADKFDKIYASSFLYSVDDIAKWPAVSVNYTNKTQFLFRINKGCLEIYDKKINEAMSENERYIPFSNMIYLGDGDTDVPCMKLVKGFGGKSIAVYDNPLRKTTAEKLYSDDRVNYISESNYTNNSYLDKYVKTCLDNIRCKMNIEGMENE